MVDNALSNFFTLKPIFQSIFYLKQLEKALRTLINLFAASKYLKHHPKT